MFKLVSGTEGRARTSGHRLKTRPSGTRQGVGFLGSRLENFKSLTSLLFASPPSFPPLLAPNHQAPLLSYSATEFRGSSGHTCGGPRSIQASGGLHPPLAFSHLGSCGIQPQAEEACTLPLLTCLLPWISSSNSHRGRGYRVWSRPAPLFYSHLHSQRSTVAQPLESGCQPAQRGCKACDLTSRPHHLMITLTLRIEGS